MKKVYLSADDFGRSPKRNKAIDECFRKGWIKSAGLIVTGQHLDNAVHLAVNGGYINHVHLHFNLSGNMDVSEANDRPVTMSMMQDKSFCYEDGRFHSYQGLPNRIVDVLQIFKTIRVYKELCAQYQKFHSITKGKGNRYHIDFHLWYNLTWSTAIALNLFTWSHKIKSVRYIGVHLLCSRRMRFFKLLSWNPFVKNYLTGNIDYFITKPEEFEKESVFELYCHPDYIDGKIIDNSVSYLGHEKKLMETNFRLLKDNHEIELISWCKE